MRVAGAVLLACLACAAGDTVEVFGQDETAPIFQLEEPSQGRPEGETVLLVSEEQEGFLHITGMLQSFRLDNTGLGSFNQLLARPHASFLDLSWNNWVDQRMEMLDMLQNLLSLESRCPHMQADSSSLDSSMVSYLASSRFGPAILTTYAERLQEDEDSDFSYEEVYIPEHESHSKSYEDATILEDLSAGAEKAFLRAEQDPRLLSQQGVGFFGANLKNAQDQPMYEAQLDGDLESLQPSIRTTPPLKFSAIERFGPEQTNIGASKFRDYAVMDVHQISGLVLFMVLCFGCIYIWGSLLQSCCRMSREMRAQRRARKAEARKVAQAELLAPLMPEGANSLPEVEVAVSHSPQGTYYAPQGAEYVTVAVPLIDGQFK